MIIATANIFQHRDAVGIKMCRVAALASLWDCLKQKRVRVCYLFLTPNVVLAGHEQVYAATPIELLLPRSPLAFMTHFRSAHAGTRGSPREAWINTAGCPESAAESALSLLALAVILSNGQ
eukprot:CAMPEP_0118941704 /NCGR_PEP_ID=MMETSP1169-20130426/34460_1 /TAXON_ID=36882 /ORGANISM="Pyramimonas obovata, Strain CCMP722" /LENGTH=120 /DNA_ID=CAMNT_0006886533 /DNA_START=145 /DNA_END=508 /DNA_ORIENTATION=-